MPTQWQAEHREQLAAYAARRYHAMTPQQRAQAKARQKRWYAAHREEQREKANERRRRRRAIDPAYRAKLQADRRAFHARHPEKGRQYARAYSFRKRFGITVEEYDAMVAAQGGRCAICRGENTRGVRLPVDHNHKTGKVRGLLCERCNLALGQFGDDPQLLERAIAYLAAGA